MQKSSHTHTINILSLSLSLSHTRTHTHTHTRAVTYTHTHTHLAIILLQKHELDDLSIQTSFELHRQLIDVIAAKAWLVCSFENQARNVMQDFPEFLFFLSSVSPLFCCISLGHCFPLHLRLPVTQQHFCLMSSSLSISGPSTPPFLPNVISWQKLTSKTSPYFPSSLDHTSFQVSSPHYLFKIEMLQKSSLLWKRVSLTCITISLTNSASFIIMCACVYVCVCICIHACMCLSVYIYYIKFV